MKSNSLLKIVDASEDNENIVILRYEPQDETHPDNSSIKHRLLKWFGRLSTFVLGVAAFAPNILHISAGFRPWVFVTFTFWVFAFCAGMFNA